MKTELSSFFHCLSQAAFAEGVFAMQNNNNCCYAGILRFRNNETLSSNDDAQKTLIPHHHKIDSKEFVLGAAEKRRPLLCY